jgi:hypothetical protein
MRNFHGVLSCRSGEAGAQQVVDVEDTLNHARVIHHE